MLQAQFSSVGHAHAALAAMRSGRYGPLPPEGTTGIISWESDPMVFGPFMPTFLTYPECDPGLFRNVTTMLRGIVLEGPLEESQCLPT